MAHFTQTKGSQSKTYSSEVRVRKQQLHSPASPPPCGFPDILVLAGIPSETVVKGQSMSKQGGGERRSSVIIFYSYRFPVLLGGLVPLLSLLQTARSRVRLRSGRHRNPMSVVLH